MCNKKPKKLLILNVLEVLKEHSDVAHPLSQKEILEHVEAKMSVDRKAIKRNLMNLVDGDYNVGYKEIKRKKTKGEEEVLYTDWYYEHEFSEPELRLLIDGLLFSKHIPYSQCKDLVKKLMKLSSKHFKARVDYISNLPVDMPNNTEIFFNIEMLDEAIAKGRQVEFAYNDFNKNGKLAPRTFDNGEIKRYVVNPYQMAATNGRYYLIGNYDKYSNISHYRVDKISDIKVLDTPAKKKKDLSEKINLPTHMAEHVYMFSGESDRVKMRIDKFLVNDVIDWFGKGVTFRDETEDTMIATVKVNLQAMRYWAMQYANYVEVLAPAKLREEIKKDLLAAVAKYGDE